MYGYKTFHEKIMQNLITNVHNLNCSHAYIFEGPNGLNKKENARLFAAALTCHKQDLAPCGVCDSCVESAANTNPDIIFISKPGNKTKIPVDSIRKITDDAAIRPFNSPRKVYIIEDGDLLTPEAQNAFLKTFEEPPSYAVFIILVNSLSSLLPTIISRAVIITFPPLSNTEIQKYILNTYPNEKERISFLINFCGGIPGTADKIIHNPEFEHIRTLSLEELGNLLSKDKLKAFEIESFIDKNKDTAELIFDFWVSFLRDILVIQCSAFDAPINTDKLSILQKYSLMFDEKHILKAIETVISTQQMLLKFVKPSAAALGCALKLC